jgi:hypothetical protein
MMNWTTQTTSSVGSEHEWHGFWWRWLRESFFRMGEGAKQKMTHWSGWGDFAWPVLMDSSSH